jgi:multiple sugar transport system substrate-binding protein
MSGSIGYEENTLTEKPVSRRSWVKYAGGAVAVVAVAGVGYAAYQSTQAPPPPPPVTTTEVVTTAAPPPTTAAATTAAATSETLQDWLKRVSAPYKGTHLVMTSEATPPSRAISSMTDSEFTPLTGITVSWELTPLEHVLEKVTMDAATCTGRYDLYYLDQSWDARFAADTIDMRTTWAQKPDLTMPNYNFDDFIPALVQHDGMYKGKLVGPPCDCPIHETAYRKDVFDKAGLSMPASLDEYMEDAKKLNNPPEMYGTTGELKGGHYSLYCDFDSILCLLGHGGSNYNADGGAALGDAESVAGLDYLTELKKYMPPGCTDWDWSGEAESVAAGGVAFYTCWEEFFPMYDTEKSVIKGLMQFHVPPPAVKLRDPSACGYDETPNICHQGASCYTVARCSKQQEAAHIFLQWATSSDIQTRGAILGGGASAVRVSTFTDPRATASPLCRHFPVTLDEIEHYMSTEPHNPWQPQIADMVSHEVANWFGGKYNTSQNALNSMRDQQNKITGYVPPA